MTFELTSFQDPELDADYVSYLVDHHAVESSIHYGRTWDYFRNPLIPAVGPAADTLNANSHPYFQAQEVGLPARITGIKRVGLSDHPAECRQSNQTTYFGSPKEVYQ